MLGKLFLWALRRSRGGTSRSWLLASLAFGAYRSVKSVTGRRELIDLGSVKKGDRITIEHLPISHKRQIKELASERRQEKKARKRAERTAAEAEKMAKQAERHQKRVSREAKRAERRERKETKALAAAERKARREAAKAERAARRARREANRATEE